MKDLKKIAESHLNGLRDMETKDMPAKPEPATGVAHDSTGTAGAQEATRPVVAQEATRPVVARDSESPVPHKESEAIIKIL